jgi:hypothetical protein
MSRQPSDPSNPQNLAQDRHVATHVRSLEDLQVTHALYRVVFSAYLCAPNSN